jgi:hypothetical protein
MNGQSADAGAIHLQYTRKIDEHIAGRGFSETAQFGAECVVTVADGDAALKIEDRHIPGLSRGNLQAHFHLSGVRDLAGRRPRIITPQVVE